MQEVIFSFIPDFVSPRRGGRVRICQEKQSRVGTRLCFSDFWFESEVNFTFFSADRFPSSIRF
jgi:hypothetical protein